MSEQTTGADSAQTAMGEAFKECFQGALKDDGNPAALEKFKDLAWEFFYQGWWARISAEHSKKEQAGKVAVTKGIQKRGVQKGESAAPFQVGDLVRHRASRRKGVVSHVSKKCATPSHQAVMIPKCAFWTNRKSCDFQPTGFYDIKLDFENTVSVHESELERA